MTKTGPSKPASPTEAGGRLAKARAFRKAAEDAIAMAEIGDIADPIISNIVLAAIAYAGAVTARFIGEVNQKDHAALGKLLKKAVGADFKPEQQRRLERILKAKSEAQYGARPGRKEEAEKLLADLEKFAVWAESLLSAKRP
jgi:hypothetical protein